MQLPFTFAILFTYAVSYSPKKVDFKSFIVYTTIPAVFGPAVGQRKANLHHFDLGLLHMVLLRSALSFAKLIKFQFDLLSHVSKGRFLPPQSHSAKFYEEAELAAV
jgi:hypothetical protein